MLTDAPLTAQPKIAVSVRDLVRTFGEFRAVNGVSFDVAEGEIFGFLGPNGAGKSTTIRMLCGLLAPTSGSGSVGGLDVRSESEAIKAGIGYMSQKFSLYDDLTAEENIDFYGGIYGVSPAIMAERKAWALRMAGLEEHRRTLTRHLSGGWKQRLALGCAILHQPRIVFLDEPTSGVDPASRRLFWDLIYDMAGHGVTVFVTTHYMDEAEYCDRVALIYRGELIAIGSPDELKTWQMREDIVEVVCERPHEVMTALTDSADGSGAPTLPGVREAALFGSGLHVVVEDAAAVAEPLRAFIEGQGHRVLRLEKITPSLEDVFVSLIEARDRQDKANVPTGGWSV